MAFFLDERIAGTGREIILSTLFGSNKYVEWYQPIGKFLGSLFSFTTGAAGGVFAPSLSIGASFSAFFSGLLHLTPDNTNLLIMTGMVAFLTGITRSPFTSAILVLEMTDRHNLIFFFMLAALMGNIASRRIHRKSLYDSIRENLLNRL
jgi:H+/Cl- antiporter ClcA